MAADPLHVGVVYLETDYLSTTGDAGADDIADRFLLSFTGGAPGTEIRELTISTDKDNDGLGIGDLIFDTVVGGRGKEGAHPFRVVRINAADPRAAVTGLVDDGGTLLTLQFSHIRAGDTIEFSIDVDEVLRMSPDLAIFNSRLDVIASGQEFHDSILTAKFVAPHYEDVTAQDIFINDFGDPQAQYGLNLPPDDGDGPDSRPNRSAAAVASTVQTPKPISISGNVFVDDNLNLRRDAEEQVLSGVNISLWRQDDSTGQYVDTGLRTQTDSQGRYHFGTNLGLMPGVYRVVETQPTGYFSVGAIPGTVDGAAVGAVSSVDVLTGIAIPLGDLHAIQYDFAEARPARIAGYVYRDDSDDGVRNANEPGIANVRVRLVPVNTIAPQVELVTTTGADGSYRFENLAPGQYTIVEVDQPAPYTDGLDTAGTIRGTVIGQAINPGDRIEGINLLGGDSGVEYNFGELPLGSISGFVYLPPPGEDCTGHFDGDAIPLADVIVRLYNLNGSLVAETRTAANGFYLFNNIPKGTYRVEEVTPAGLLDGTAHVGLIDNVKVGQVLGDGSLAGVRLPAGKHGEQYNFCEAAPATLTGYVYHDQSNDGVRDSSEAGIAGVQVRLYDASGRVVATTQTDSTGRYAFLDLVPGTYRIQEYTPQGYLDGLDTAGTIGSAVVGTAVNPGDEITGVILKQGQKGIEYNFGEILPARIEGFVHSDLDNDCFFDANEQPIAGVTIRLLNSSGEQLAQTVTDVSGRYRFEGLRPGNYTVVQDQPNGYFSGGQVAGTTGGNASIENRISQIVITSGVNSLQNNFCENPPAEIRGNVYVDRDGDCIRDADERGISDVLIELIDDTGRVIATTRTNGQGEYRFENLRAGNYSVRETQPIGYLQGGQRAGSGGGDASQQDLIRSITIGWADRLIDYDFCELEPSSIAGTVYVDDDGDCLYEPEHGERPLAGVTIRLHDATGTVIASVLTDAAGRYQFNNLRPGEYSISEIQPTGYFQGGQTVGSGGGVIGGADLITQIQIGPGQNLVDYNFCEIEPAALSGSVFVDHDEDCTYEPDQGESPLAGVVIRLHDANGNVVATTQTDANGNYRFENLVPGTYSVSEVQPEGYYQGGQRIGSGGGVVLGQDHIGQIVIPPGTRLEHYDFCEVTGSTLSGRVWSDTDLDDLFDSNEQPIEGVLIELLDVTGSVVQTTRTSANGMYEFLDIAPGEYTVRETQPRQFFHGGQVAGSHGGNARVADRISSIRVPGGATLTRYDFPEDPPAMISGYVFQDGGPIVAPEVPTPQSLREYQDGVFTSDDTPLAGVVLELRTLTGQPFDVSLTLPGTYDGPFVRVVTDANGYYEFPGLRGGSYHVYQVQPDGFIDGLDTPGSNGGKAVNAADIAGDPELQFFFSTLAGDETTDPRMDAILNIGVGVGQHARVNNFSEIKVETLPPREQEYPKQTISPAPVGPWDTFGKPSLPYQPFVRPEIPPYRLFFPENNVAWHLSVINGGSPRGNGLQVEAIYRMASDRQVLEEWTEAEAGVGVWRLFDGAGNETSQGRLMTFGVLDGIPVVGDFNGDGRDEMAMFVRGQWLIDLNGNGRWDSGDLWARLGSGYDRPVAGDWDGDGKDDIGIFGPEWVRDPLAILRESGLPDPENRHRLGRKNTPPNEEDATSGRRFLRKHEQAKMRVDVVDHVFRYGQGEDIPLAGDWNGDGIDAIAVFNAGRWKLDSNGDGRWSEDDERIEFGEAGDIPVVGDWNGDGIDDVAIVRGDLWIIDADGDRRLTAADIQIVIPREGGEVPIAGDWDGDGRAEPGYYQPTRRAADSPELPAA